MQKAMNNLRSACQNYDGFKRSERAWGTRAGCTPWCGSHSVRRSAFTLTLTLNLSQTLIQTLTLTLTVTQTLTLTRTRTRTRTLTLTLTKFVQWGFDETSLNEVPTMNQWCRIMDGGEYKIVTLECAGLLKGFTSTRVAQHIKTGVAGKTFCVATIRGICTSMLLIGGTRNI